jgi:4-amino-4-deoxy-L-arabinose transferase-like glycosyltransferase
MRQNGAGPAIPGGAALADTPARRRTDWIFAGLVLVVALALRLNQYTQAPAFHDNPDEVQFPWAGLSLLTQHVPETWSYFPEYRHYTWLVLPDGASYPLVKPWLDHPPLFPLLSGAAAWIAGERSFAQVTAASVRIPTIWLSLLSLLLMYALARRVLGPRPAMVAAVIFATAPGAVLFSRSVETEALLAPLLLGALLALHRLLAGDGGRGSIAALMICCALAPLTKVPGLAVGGIVIVVLLADRRWRLAVAAGAATVAGLAVFALYGLALNWNLFVAIWQEQAAHRSGVMGAFEFIIEPAGLNRRFSDPWWLLGWIGIGAMVSRRFSPRSRVGLVAWPVIAYSATMLVVADVRVAYFGWYRIAIYPLVYLAAGYLAWRALAAANPAVVTLVLITGGAAAASSWLGGPQALGIASATLAGVLLAAVIGLVSLWRREPDRARAVTAVALACVIVGNIVVSAQLDRLYLRI